MGNIILSNDFVMVDDDEITARSETAGFDKIGVMDYVHFNRRFRADDDTKSDSNYLLKFDLGSARALAGVFVDGVNFNKTRLRGHASDLSTNWTSASFDSGEISLSLDERVDRYKGYIPFTSFNYRWIALQVPAAAAAVGPYTAKWEVRRVAILASVVELSVNMARDYERSASLTYVDLAPTAERIAHGSDLKFACKINLGRRSLTQEAQLWAINRMDIGGPLFFAENMGHSQHAYICKRDDAYTGILRHHNRTEGNRITLQELV